MTYLLPTWQKILHFLGEPRRRNLKMLKVALTSLASKQNMQVFLLLLHKSY